MRTGRYGQVQCTEFFSIRRNLLTLKDQLIFWDLNFRVKTFFQTIMMMENYILSFGSLNGGKMSLLLYWSCI